MHRHIFLKRVLTVIAILAIMIQGSFPVFVGGIEIAGAFAPPSLGLREIDEPSLDNEIPGEGEISWGKGSLEVVPSNAGVVQSASVSSDPELESFADSLDELVPGFDYVDAFENTTGHGTSIYFGSYAMVGDDSKLYVTFSAGRPTDSASGAMLGVFDGNDFVNVASLDEDGISDVEIDKDNNILYIAGSDPSNGDDWTAGNVYTYDTTQSLPGTVVKHRDAVNGLDNVFHTFDLFLADDGRLYAATGSHNGDVTPQNRYCGAPEAGRCFGEIFVSDDQAQTWTSLSTPFTYRATDVFELNGVLYTVGSNYLYSVEGVPQNYLRKSTDGGLTWEDVSLAQTPHQLYRVHMQLFQSKLNVFGRNTFSFPYADALLTVDPTAPTRADLPFLQLGGTSKARWNIMTVDNSRQLVYVADKDGNIWRSKDFTKWGKIYSDQHPANDLEIASLYYWDAQDVLIVAEGYQEGKLKKLDLSTIPTVEADFAVSTERATLGTSVEFTDMSYNYLSNTQINSWKWDFDGDGVVDSTEQNPTWVYSHVGTYSVTLTVSDGDSTDTVTKNAVITIDPFADRSNDPFVAAEMRTTGYSSNSANWIDYNNDGVLDLFVSNGRNMRRENNALFSRTADDAAFTPISNILTQDSRSSGQAVWGDIDNDGDLDLFVPNFYWGDVDQLFRNDGEAGFVDITGTHTPFTYGSSTSGNFGDIDGDGDLDLYVTTWSTHANLMYINDGTGHFQLRTTGEEVLPQNCNNSQMSTFGDYDKDGDIDLFVANSSDAFNRLYKNDGNGNFVLVNNAVSNDQGATRGGSWGDYDNDGDLDLFVANVPYWPTGTSNYYGHDRLFRNDGGDVFTQVEIPGLTDHQDRNKSTESAMWIDVDNDGWLDLYITQPLGQNAIYMNHNGDLQYMDKSVSYGSTFGYADGQAWGDYDGDGDLDLYVTEYADKENHLYQNESQESDNKWLAISLVGSPSNWYAYGARVEVSVHLQSQYTPLQPQGVNAIDPLKTYTRELTNVQGYNAQQEPRLFFGLGNAQGTADITVYWPDGTVTSQQGVNTNQAITIYEANVDVKITNTIPSVLEEGREDLPIAVTNKTNHVVENATVRFYLGGPGLEIDSDWLAANSCSIAYYRSYSSYAYGRVDCSIAYLGAYETLEITPQVSYSSGGRGYVYGVINVPNDVYRRDNYTYKYFTIHSDNFFDIALTAPQAQGVTAGVSSPLQVEMSNVGTISSNSTLRVVYYLYGEQARFDTTSDIFVENNCRTYEYHSRYRPGYVYSYVICILPQLDAGQSRNISVNAIVEEGGSGYFGAYSYNQGDYNYRNNYVRSSVTALILESE